MQILMAFLEKWLAYIPRGFWLVFIFFDFSLTLSLLEKLKNLSFKDSKIPKTLNIDDLRTPGVKSFTLHTTRKLIKCSWKIFGKKKFTFTAFDILLFQFMFILTSALQSTGNERVRVWVKNHQNIHILL